MDGNRRWAKSRNLLKFFGHKQGVTALENIIKISPKYGVSTLTVYAFSTENNKRDPEEVKDLFSLMATVAKKRRGSFVKNGIKVAVLGDLDSIPDKYSNEMRETVETTKNCDNLLIQICINYGGRDEIVRAVERVISKDILLNIESLQNNLDSSLQPDLIIRTGGHRRLSNFLIWQSAYSELYFTDILWPDFDEKELVAALDFYKKEKRNFGK